MKRGRRGWCRRQSSGGIDDRVIEGHGGVSARGGDQPVGELGIERGRGVRGDRDAEGYLEVAHDSLEVAVAGGDDLGDVRGGVDRREREHDLTDELDKLKVAGRGCRVSNHRRGGGARAGAGALEDGPFAVDLILRPGDVK